MRRLLAPVTLLLLAFAPAAAQAAVGSEKEKNTDDVRAYWTDERMRDAKPKNLDRPGQPVERGKPSRPGGGGLSWSPGSGAFPGDALVETNGKVFFTEAGVDYVCSGTAVNTDSRSVVWTAGHCVHGGGPGKTFHTKWAFVPAYNNGTRPYGTFAATSLYTTSEWAGAGAFGRDVGAAHLALPIPAVEGLTALRPMSFTRPSVNDRILSYGYPAAGKFNGQTLKYCDSYVASDDLRQTPATMAIPCDMTGGSSGGGWLNASRALVSVNSYGYSSVKNTMYGPSIVNTDDVLIAAEAGNGNAAVAATP